MTEDDLKRLFEQTFYHGTTRKSWEAAAEHEFGGLFVTTRIEDALNYADEAGICEAINNEENELPENSHEAVIVSISGADLIKLLEATADRPALEMEPDWGWVGGRENLARYNGEAFNTPGWQHSLSACGCIFLSGFTEADKSAFLATAASEYEDKTEKYLSTSFRI